MLDLDPKGTQFFLSSIPKMEFDLQAWPGWQDSAATDAANQRAR